MMENEKSREGWMDRCETKKDTTSTYKKLHEHANRVLPVEGNLCRCRKCPNHRA